MSQSGRRDTGWLVASIALGVLGVLTLLVRTWQALAHNYDVIPIDAVLLLFAAGWCWRRADGRREGLGQGRTESVDPAADIRRFRAVIRSLQI